MSGLRVDQVRVVSQDSHSGLRVGQVGVVRCAHAATATNRPQIVWVKRWPVFIRSLYLRIHGLYLDLIRDRRLLLSGSPATLALKTIRWQIPLQVMSVDGDISDELIPFSGVHGREFRMNKYIII